MALRHSVRRTRAGAPVWANSSVLSRFRSYMTKSSSIQDDNSVDVAIIGGGVMGSSTAYHLLKRNSNLRVAVFEKDASYARASTSLSVGSLRVQFSNEENVLLSKHSWQFIQDISKHLALSDGEPIDIGWSKGQYLLLASPNGWDTLQENIALQHSVGVDTILLKGSDEVKKRFPYLNVDGLAGAGYGGSHEGWLDPYSLMQAFRKKAVELGARYIEADVRGLQYSSADQEVTAVDLFEGASATEKRYKCGLVINAAGALSADIVDMLEPPPEMRLQLRPRKRCVFKFQCQEAIRPADPNACVPLTVDTNGVYYRPEGTGFVAGVSPEEERDPDAYGDFEVDWSLWDDIIWPTIAERASPFEAVKVTGAWAGHYEFNTKDHNGIVGRHPYYPNLYLITGFSGHGLQQSPAAGQALAELILDGKYSTVDLNRLGFDRFLTGDLVVEKNVF